MANDPYSFYVRMKPDGSPAESTYHLGTCNMVGEGWKRFSTAAAAAEWEMNGKQRGLTCTCKDNPPPARPGYSILPYKLNPRDVPGAKFFVKDHSPFYHSYRDCRNLKNEKGGNIYGFVTEQEAQLKSIYRDKSQKDIDEPTRGPCFSIAQRDDDKDTCYGHSQR